MKDIKAKVDYILKHNMLINKLFKLIGNSCFKIIGIFIKVDEKAILFSGQGGKYNDSPRAIYEYMISKPEYQDYTFFWGLNDISTQIPGTARKIKIDTWKYFKIALACKYWVACVNIERSLHFKKKRTIYLNTWHGIPIKTVGNEAEGRKDFDFSYINYFCISGDYEIDLYKRSFCISKDQILKTGMPRNDTLYNTTSDEVLKIKKNLGLPLDKKILFYAPTWRDSRDGGKSYAIKPPMNIAHWKKVLKNDYILLFRTHSYTNKLLGIDFNDFVRNYTDYPNVNDLMKISDILISDYSAVILDYAILERPIISFAYDYEEYGRNRGFALDIQNEMPGGICKTEDEVISRILNMDYNKEIALVKKFKNKYLQYGGHATEQCVDCLFKSNSEESNNIRHIRSAASGAY